MHEMKTLEQNEGVSIYIVGGYVRDRLLGNEGKDHDFVVVGATPEQMLDAGFKKVGADFPVFLNDVGDEFALARTERKTGTGYSGFETTFDPSITLKDDLIRRDLTINALAREVIGWNDQGHAKLSDEIIDPFNGQEDLKNGILRHVSEAFAEDPLRVLRIARFASRYGFTIAPETQQLMQQLTNSGELNELNVERMWLELSKTLTEPNPYRFFETLHKVGGLKSIFKHIDQSNLQQIVEKSKQTSNLAPPFRLPFLMSKVQQSQFIKWADWFKLPTMPKTRCLDVIQLVSDHDSGVDIDSAKYLFDWLRQGKRYESQERIDDVLSVTRLLIQSNTFHKYVNEAANVMKTVNFNSLPDDQRDLKGASIGQAIDQIRLSKIESLIKG